MRIMRRTGRGKQRLALGCILLLCGCELPDLQPFADATLELSTAVGQSGKAVKSALEENDMADEATSFEERFGVRVEAMKAFVAYSDSLAAIAAAGKQGRENATKVADAFNGLLGQVNALAPGVGALPQNVVGVISEGYALVAQVRAARSMEAAVKSANPVVQKLAQALMADFGDMKTVFVNVEENIVARIEGCRLPKDEFGCQNLDELQAVRKSYSARMSATELAIADAANNGKDPTAKQLADLKNWTSLMTEVDKRLNARLALLETAHREYRVRIALVDQTREGFAAWAQIHGGLAEDLEAGTQPTLANLKTATKSLQGLIEKVQAL